jgi:hypothetical protein
LWSTTHYGGDRNLVGDGEIEQEHRIEKEVRANWLYLLRDRIFLKLGVHLLRDIYIFLYIEERRML